MPKASNLGPTIMVIEQQLMLSSTVLQGTPGDKVYTNDGRTFRYCYVGAAALVAGNVIQSPAIVANHVNLTPTAVSAIGDTTVTVTLGNTAATLNQYALGYLTVELSGGTGAGQMLLIDHNPAASGSATMVVSLADPFFAATSSTVTMDLVMNNYGGTGVIQYPITTGTGVPVGVAVFPLAINNYGFIQTRGIAPVLSNGAQSVGVTAAAVPSAVAGAAKVMAATLFSIGTWQKTTIDTQIAPMYLTID